MAFKLVLLKGANIRKTITVRLLAWTVQKVLFPHALLLYHTNRRHDTLPFNPVVLKLSNVGLIHTTSGILQIPMPVFFVVMKLAHVEPFLLRDAQLAETMLLALAPLANVSLICLVVMADLFEADSVRFVATRLAPVLLPGNISMYKEVTAARHGLSIVPRTFPLF